MLACVSALLLVHVHADTLSAVSLSPARKWCAWQSGALLPKPEPSLSEISAIFFLGTWQLYAKTVGLVRPKEVRTCAWSVVKEGIEQSTHEADNNKALLNLITEF